MDQLFGGLFTVQPIGSRRAKNAAPDGYTLLVLHDAILTAKAAGRANYGPEVLDGSDVLNARVGAPPS